MDLGHLLLIFKLNIIIVICYVLFYLIFKKENRSGFVLKSVIMLLCPLIGPLFIFLSYYLYLLLFSEIADLSDVIFSKERVKVHLRAEEERERNMVSVEEALVISDKYSLRNLMMNVVKSDVSGTLDVVSSALNSSDSETSHYAASVLQDELNNFRNKVQKLKKHMEEDEDSRVECASEILDYTNGMLEQKVFTNVEQVSFVKIMDEAAEVLYETDCGMITGEQYEAIVLRNLEIEYYDRCKVWCDRCKERYPSLLSTYTCQLKLFFSTGEKEKFFETMQELKESNITIDNETLEMIRVFS